MFYFSYCNDPFKAALLYWCAWIGIKVIKVCLNTNIPNNTTKNYQQSKIQKDCVWESERHVQSTDLANSSVFYDMQIWWQTNKHMVPNGTALKKTKNQNVWGACYVSLYVKSQYTIHFNYNRFVHTGHHCYNSSSPHFMQSVDNLLHVNDINLIIQIYFGDAKWKVNSECV